MDSKYWDIPMNFIGGCSPCADGCTHCWAADCASKRLANHRLYKGLTKNGKWTGEVRVMPELIKIIGGAPKTIFWCNMADMFHDKVRFEDIDTAFGAMFSMPQHRHLVLTKRIERAFLFYLTANKFHRIPPNAHLGATICNQEEADKKIPILLQIPAAYRWLSIEPMLSYIDIETHLCPFWYSTQSNGGVIEMDDKPILDWVVVGCESGPNRRPCKSEWIRSIVEQCKAADTGCYVKQMEINGKVEHDMSKFPAWAQVRDTI